MDRFQFRRDTSARWTSINPILLEGEIGVETDTKLRKMGDGVNRWNNLDYLAAENITQELGDSETATVSQKVITEAIDEQKYKLYPSMGIFGMPAVDYNHLANYDDTGAFIGYISSDAYDCAWVYIFEGSTTIKVEGATPSIIGYFNGKTPELGTLLGKGTTIPSGAKLCLVNFIKAENPNGYANLVIRQEGMASSVEAVDGIAERVTLLEPTEVIATELATSFEATPISKNFLDTVDTLVGWGFDSGAWVKNSTLGSSGKMYLKDSQTYTAQNVRAYGTNLNMYIAAFVFMIII